MCDAADIFFSLLFFSLKYGQYVSQKAKDES